MTNKNDAMQALNCAVDSNLNFNGSTTSLVSNNTFSSNYTCWDYWQNYYYPYVIRESYPVYLEKRAMDKGKIAFEIVKILNDKRLTKIETVKDFIEAMDALLKIL